MKTKLYIILGFASLFLLFSCNPDDDTAVGEIPGCTDSTAFNFNPDATVNDFSCEPVVYGCLCECSQNYDPIANTDDGSCNLDRDRFLGTYSVVSARHWVDFDTTISYYYHSVISIDSLDCCRVKISNHNFFPPNVSSFAVSGNDIIIPTIHQNTSNGWFEDYGGLAHFENDTLFTYSYQTSISGALIVEHNEIWVKQ